MCSKLTYFHSQYVKLYQKAEEKEFKRLLEEKELVSSSDRLRKLTDLTSIIVVRDQKYRRIRFLLEILRPMKSR